MGRLQSWSAAARHSRLFWVVAAVVVLGLVAGGIALATRPGSTPPTAPQPATTRAVALGDSVPYGHGLANPYLTPQPGLPPDAVSQPPSRDAYPSLVAHALGLTMTVRPTNCGLVGDQLAISGAVADPSDDTNRDAQCPVPPEQARNLDDEVAAADLAAHPARLVLLQAGADDIDFGACLEYELARLLGTGLGLGTSCLTNGALAPSVSTQLSSVRTSLARTIETMSPHAGTIAVLDYYQPIPQPSEIADGATQRGSGTNLVCAGLKANAAATYAAAQVVSGALNHTIAGAVADARAHHVGNVTLVDVSGVGAGHGICTADPYFFSGEPAPDATLAEDAARIAAAKVCSSTTILRGEAPCVMLTAAAAQAERELKSYVWRAAHPTATGQRAIAGAVEEQLHLDR